MSIEFIQLPQEHISNLFHSSDIPENITGLFFHHFVYIIIYSFHPMHIRINCSGICFWAAAVEFSHYYACSLGFSSGIPSEGPIQRPLKVNGTFSAGVNYTAPFISANIDSVHQMIPPNLHLRGNWFSYMYIGLVLDCIPHIHRVHP